MHFSSISSCEPLSIVTLQATNTDTAGKNLYLPALSSFTAIQIGTTTLNLSTAAQPLLVPAGNTVIISLATPATEVTTVFYQYAVETVGSATRWAGYFSVTTRNPIVAPVVLLASRNKKWYNYTAKSQSLVFYTGGTAYPLTSGTGVGSLAMPIHVVPDPASGTAYIYNAVSGTILSRYDAPKGDKPFTYKTVTFDVLYKYPDLTGITKLAAGTALKSSFSVVNGYYSAKFNGINSYLYADNAELEFGTADWCVECWIYPRALPSTDPISSATWPLVRNSLAMLLSTVNVSFGFGATKIFAVFDNNIAAIGNHGMTVAASTSSWYHIAFERSGSTINIFVNGQLAATASGFATNIRLANYTTDSPKKYPCYFGTYENVGARFNGYMTNVHIVQNTTLYSTKTIPFTPNNKLILIGQSTLGLDFDVYTTDKVSPGAAIDNTVYILTTGGILTKIEFNSSSIASPKIPAPSSSAKRVNWFISSGLSFEEDVPFLGSFATASLLKKSTSLAPGVLCVDYFNDVVYVGSTSGIYVIDPDTLNIRSSITLPFASVSITASASGIVVTTLTNNVYFVTYAGSYSLLYSATVLGLPAKLDDYLYIPEPQASQLVVFDLTVVGPTTSAPTRFDLVGDRRFAPAFVAVDTSQRKIFVCGHDSDIVYYSLGSGAFTPIQFDNKVAWLSAVAGTIIASYYLIDETVLDVSQIRRPARITLPSRTGSVGTLIGTAPVVVKMIGKHSGVGITVPGDSISTVLSIGAGSIPAWVTNFQSATIYSWSNGVKNPAIIAHNDSVSVTYGGADTTSLMVRIPYVVGDRATSYDVSLGSFATAYPKNIFSSKAPAISAFNSDLNTAILLHFNDTPGYSLFTDSAGSGTTVYIGTGLVVVSNVQSKFDGLSASFAASSYITVPATAALGFGVGDFTIELWIYTTGGSKKLIVPTTIGTGKWAFYINSSGAIEWSTGTSTFSSGVVTVADGTWHHVAVTRASSTIIMYVDGTPVFSDLDSTNYAAAGIVNYTLGGSGATITSGGVTINGFVGFMDELRISSISRYSAKFLPGVPGYILSSPVRTVDVNTLSAKFDTILYKLGIYTPVAALEYGELRVNGIKYDGTYVINTDDHVTVTLPFNSVHSTLAPILTIGKKEFALPINLTTQTLANYTIEVVNTPVSTRVDYVGNIIIAVAGEYYFPNYSSNVVTAVKLNGTAMVPGTYNTMAVGDTVDIYGLKASARMNDTVDVFLIGPQNYQISVETVKTSSPKFMDFGVLTTQNQYSADPLVNYSYTTVGSLTQPFVRFRYISDPVTVTGIPNDPATGLGVDITLTTDQASSGAYLIKTPATGAVVQGATVSNVVNGDTIQIVKTLVNYRETGITLQVSYIDTDTGIADVADCGKWRVSPTTVTSIAKTFTNKLLNNVFPFAQDHTAAYKTSLAQQWQNTGYNVAIGLNSNLGGFAHSAAVGGSNSANISYTWASQPQSSLHFGNIPYTWSSQPQSSLHFGNIPYTWASQPQSSLHLGARPYTWDVNFIDTGHSLNANTVWDKQIDNMLKFNQGIEWVLSAANLAVVSQGSMYNKWTAIRAAENYRSLFGFNRLSVNAAVNNLIYSPGYAPRASILSGIVPQFLSIADNLVFQPAPGALFNPAPVYGVHPVPTAKFMMMPLQVRIDLSGVFLPRYYNYGLAAAAKSKFMFSREYGFGPSPLSQRGHGPGLGRSAAPTPNFEPHQTQGLDFMKRPFFLPYQTLALEAMRQATFFPSQTQAFKAMRSELLPLQTLVYLDTGNFTFLPLQTQVLKDMWQSTFLPLQTQALEAMRKSTFLPLQTQALEAMRKSTFFPLQTQALEAMRKSTFFPLQTQALEAMRKSTFFPLQTQALEAMRKSTFFPLQTQVLKDMWQSTFFPLQTQGYLAIGTPIKDQSQIKTPDYFNPYKLITESYLEVLPQIVQDHPNKLVLDYHLSRKSRFNVMFDISRPLLRPNDYSLVLAATEFKLSINSIKHVASTSNKAFASLDCSNTNRPSWLNFLQILVSPKYRQLQNTEILIAPGTARTVESLSTLPTQFGRTAISKMSDSSSSARIFRTLSTVSVSYPKDISTVKTLSTEFQRLQEFLSTTNLLAKFEINPIVMVSVALELNTERYRPGAWRNLLPISVQYLSGWNNLLPISVQYLSGQNNLLPISVEYQLDRTTKILSGFVAQKYVPKMISTTVRYVVDGDMLWDLTRDYTRYGTFATSAEATADATAKNYSNFIVRQITSGPGATYFTYFVTYNNDFVCGLSTPKVPQYGLIQGG